MRREAPRADLRNLSPAQCRDKPDDSAIGPGLSLANQSCQSGATRRLLLGRTPQYSTLITQPHEPLALAPSTRAWPNAGEAPAASSHNEPSGTQLELWWRSRKDLSYVPRRFGGQCSRVVDRLVRNSSESFSTPMRDHDARLCATERLTELGAIVSFAVSARPSAWRSTACRAELATTFSWSTTQREPTVLIDHIPHSIEENEYDRDLNSTMSRHREHPPLHSTSGDSVSTFETLSASLRIVQAHAKFGAALCQGLPPQIS